MRSQRNFRAYIYIIGVFALAALLFGCGRKPLFFAYSSTSVEGWEPGDTLKFHVDSVEQGGDYRLSLWLRTSVSEPYPFTSLWLVMRTQLHRPDTLLCDTTECRLINEQGESVGHGISLFQYSFPLKSLHLPTGSSADIRIFHIMRREVLPGITDVGVRFDPAF